MRVKKINKKENVKKRIIKEYSNNLTYYIIDAS